jgi:hypothetical protein
MKRSDAEYILYTERAAVALNFFDQVCATIASHNETEQRLVMRHDNEMHHAAAGTMSFLNTHMREALRALTVIDEKSYDEPTDDDDE